MAEINSMAPEPTGYIVLLSQHGRWTDDWDGTVHTTEDDGLAALGKARAAGYNAILTVARPVGEPGLREALDERFAEATR